MHVNSLGRTKGVCDKNSYRKRAVRSSTRKRSIQVRRAGQRCFTASSTAVVACVPARATRRTDDRHRLRGAIAAASRQRLVNGRTQWTCRYRRRAYVRYACLAGACCRRTAAAFSGSSYTRERNFTGKRENVQKGVLQNIVINSRGFSGDHFVSENSRACL